MTMQRYAAICKYQKSFPPIHKMLASYFGISNSAATQSGTPGKDEPNAIQALIGVPGVNISDKPTKTLRLPDV